MSRILTASEIRAWKSCPMKWWFRYDQLLVPKKPLNALSYGSLVHEGLEALYRGEDWRIAVGRFVRERVTPWNRKETAYVVAQAIAILNAYSEREPATTMGHKVHSVEREFYVRLVSPAGRRFSRYVLAGKRDLATADEYGNVYLWDHKTGSKEIDPEWIQIDDQMSYYLWADAQDGIPASHLMYNLLRKPQIKPRQKETPREWGERLAQDIESRPDFYFQRAIVVKTAIDIEDIGRELWDIAHAIDCAPIVRNPHNCTVFGCAYRSLCRRDSMITRQAEFMEERVHAELQEVV